MSGLDVESFLDFLKENLQKVRECMEKVTVLHHDTAVMLLEISSLFHPEVLIDLYSMTDNGTKCDEFIREAQLIKDEIAGTNEPLLESLTTNYYQKLLDDVEALEKEVTLTPEKENHDLKT